MTEAPPISGPIHWEYPEEGGTKAGDLRLPFILGHDDSGLLLIIDGQAEMIAPSLRKQVKLILHRLKVPIADGDLLRLTNDLQKSVDEQRGDKLDIHRAALFQGELAELLRDELLPERLQPSDLKTLMEIGAQPVPMLVPTWVVEGELHWMYAPPEAGKTWVALHIAGVVLNDGGRVVWIDEEVGAVRFAQRLVTLGIEPWLVDASFFHLPFPSLGEEAVDSQIWEKVMEAGSPDLVVIDTATDALAEVGADENKGDEVTRWVKDFAEPARRAGAAVLILDHVTKDAHNPKAAIGSRAKWAKAKVQYRIDPIQSFRDRNKSGHIQITCTKNTHAADIPEDRHYEIGGDPFEFRLMAEMEVVDIKQSKSDQSIRVKNDIQKLLRENPESQMSKRQIRAQVRCDNNKLADYLDDMATSQLWQIKAEAKANSVVYSYDPEPPEPDEPDDEGESDDGAEHG